jgi:hypothetical protein
MVSAAAGSGRIDAYGMTRKPRQAMIFKEKAHEQ